MSKIMKDLEKEIFLGNLFGMKDEFKFEIIFLYIYEIC